MTRSLQIRCRRLIAYALAYAFALQGLIFALDLGNSAFAAANGAAWAGFELCSHSGVSPTAPGAPHQGPMGNVHCMFCVAGAVFLDSTPPAPPHYQKVALAGAMTAKATLRLVALLLIAGAWPRGPPA
ncbi:MAG TPA: hypothetical protein VMF66_06375 [Candidatus Acidoferrum sp.]|nr:hypothetical protein [Candidatus Acidoferrum sp.]